MNRVAGCLLLLLLIGGCVPQSPGRRLERIPVVLRGPEESATLLRGGTQPVNVAVDRSADFVDDVVLRVAVYPSEKGVTAEVIPTTLRPGDDGTVRLNVSAAAMARDGEYTVVMRGKFATGQTPPLEMTFRVPKGN